MNLTEPSDKTKYRFDGVVVDGQDYVVEKHGTAVALTPRAFDVLLMLLENSGHVVEKRELFDRIWKETFVSDNALSKIVKELRHALDDSADAPRYIETIPKRGYRFIGTLENGVRRQDTNNSASKVTTSSSKVWAVAVAAIVVVTLAAGAWFAFSRRDSIRTPSSIAVLPFKPLDAGSRDESLELGMAETLITRLSNLHDVVVRPIGSVRKFTDPTHDPVKAGEELQTEAVLDGSIQKAGDRVRVTARLVDVRSGATLWSEQFDESFTDIFRVQDSIAQRIANVLALKLSRQEEVQLAKHVTENPEAYALYLHGQFLWHRRGPGWINKSMDAYKLALEKDPNFALAHIGLADAYMMLNGHRRISAQEAETYATPHIIRALEIDNSLAQAHNALAELKYQYQYDWPGAEEEFNKAIELNPNVAWIRQAYGWFLMSDGKFDEADKQIQTARQLDPSSLTLSAALGRLYYHSRQYDLAETHFQELLSQAPNDASLHLALFSIHRQQQQYGKAVDDFLKVETLSGAPAEFLDELRTIFELDGWDGFMRKLLRELDSRSEKTGKSRAWAYADNYAQLKDKENTFYWFERAAESRDVAMLQLKIDPAFDFLRDDPRYAKLLRGVGQEP